MAKHAQYFGGAEVEPTKGAANKGAQQGEGLALALTVAQSRKPQSAETIASALASLVSVADTVNSTVVTLILRAMREHGVDITAGIVKSIPGSTSESGVRKYAGEVFSSLRAALKILGRLPETLGEARAAVKSERDKAKAKAKETEEVEAGEQEIGLALNAASASADKAQGAIIAALEALEAASPENLADFAARLAKLHAIAAKAEADKAAALVAQAKAKRTRKAQA